MDLRNVIFAIALSFAVLFGWSVIFETPQMEEQKKSQQTEGYQKKDGQSSDTPSVNVENTKVPNISRENAIGSGKRIKFENKSVTSFALYFGRRATAVPCLLVVVLESLF